jgi:FG-GAP-like repeat
MRIRALFTLLILPVFALSQPTFLEHSVSQEVSNPLGVVVADLNQDNQVEVIFGEYSSGNIFVLSGSGDTWAHEIIAGGISGILDIDTGDLDGDGDVDIAGTAYNMNQLYWWENTDQGWLQHLVADYSTPRRILAQDLDADGDLDLLCSSQSQGVWWFENNGTGTVWTNQIIYTSGNYWGVAAGDVDADGDIDLMSSSEANNNIFWHENTGEGYTHHTITQQGNGPKDIEAVDMDDDGDLDALVAAVASDEISWYENAAELPWPAHQIARFFNSPNDVDAADIDMDGDLDVVGVGYTENVVAWWEDTGNSWQMHTLLTGYSWAWNADVVDMDNDGDLDIATIAYGSSRVDWLEQEGSPGPVQFSLFPQVVTVPPGGGDVVYDASLISELPNSVPGLSYWTAAELPNGQLYGPLSRINFTLQPFMNAYVTGLTQTVPAQAPTGTYLFTGYVGFFPIPQMEDSFSFVKIGARGMGIGIELMDPEMEEVPVRIPMPGESDRYQVLQVVR